MKIIRIIFKYRTVDKSKVLDVVGNIPLIIDIKLKGFNGYSKRIKSAPKNHFNITAEELSVGFNSGANPQLDQIILKLNVKCYQTTDKIVRSFLSVGDFVHAWVVDDEYCFWQNAYEPLQYDAKGRSYEGLPMRLNGLPSPLEKMIIDTTNNPGREVFKTGYIEAVGSVFWLSDEFFNLTGANKENLYSQDDCKVIEKDGILCGLLDKNFLAGAEGDNELEQKQNKLRKILYPA